MRVYANEVSGRVDRLEQRVAGVEHRSAPPTPQSTISVSDSQSPAQNKPDSSDVDSNPDEAEIALELGESLDTYIECTCKCTCTYSVSLTVRSSTRARCCKTGEAGAQEATS